MLIFTSDCARSHLSRKYSSSSMLSYCTSFRPVLILSSHLCLGLPSGHSLSGLPTKTLYVPVLAPHVLHTPPSLLFLIWSPELYWWGVQIIKLLVMQSSPLPCYLVPLTSKYPPHYPILEHLQPVSPTLWENRFHTHIKRGKIRVWYI